MRKKDVREKIRKFGKRKRKGKDCKAKKLKTAREQSSGKSSRKREKGDWTIPEIEGGKL